MATITPYSLFKNQHKFPFLLLLMLLPGCFSGEVETTEEVFLESRNLGEDSLHTTAVCSTATCEGENCVESGCHNGGSDNVVLPVSGTIFHSDSQNLNLDQAYTESYATIEFYSGPGGSGELVRSLQVDFYGNFYSTEPLTTAVYPALRYHEVPSDETSPIKRIYMPRPIAPILPGSCNSCHNLALPELSSIVDPDNLPRYMRINNGVVSSSNPDLDYHSNGDQGPDCLTCHGAGGTETLFSMAGTVYETEPLLSINAGADLSVNSGDTVNLHVDYAITNGQTSILWENDSSVVISDLSGTDTADVQFTAPVVSQATSIRFNVTVTIVRDGQTNIGMDTVSVTVNPAASPANTPPTANAGQNLIVQAGENVAITGSGTASNGTVSSYQWVQLNATPSVLLNNSNTQTVSFVAPPINNSPATVLLAFTVTDDSGTTGTDVVAIAITPPYSLGDAAIGLFPQECDDQRFDCQIGVLPEDVVLRTLTPKTFVEINQRGHFYTTIPIDWTNSTYPTLANYNEGVVCRNIQHMPHAGSQQPLSDGNCYSCHNGTITNEISISGMADVAQQCF